MRRRIMHRFARREFEILTGRAVERLRRREASGLFGNPEHRSLWDEFRHDRRTGPHPALEIGFDDAVDAVVRELVAAVPAHAATLLSEHARWSEHVRAEEAAMDDVDVLAVESRLRSLVDDAALD